MASCCRRYRARRLKALGDDPQLLVIRPAPPATSLYHLKPFKLSTALMAVHKDCYAPIGLIQQGAPRRRETDRAIQSNPNYGSAYRTRGYLRVWDGGSDTASADFERSMRFSPRDPYSYTSMLGMAFGHYKAGRYAEAANWADRAIRAFPPWFIPGLQIAIMIYVGAGRIEDAQRVMADCL